MRCSPYLSRDNSPPLDIASRRGSRFTFCAVRSISFFVALASGGLVLRGETAPVPERGAPPLTEPLPSVVAFAEHQKVPVGRITTDTTRTAAGIGDEVVVLLSEFRDGSLMQWLGRFRIVEPTPQERTSPPTEIVRYSSKGAKHVFTSKVSTIEMELFGPFRGVDPTAEPVGDRRARIQVRTDFLALGLDQWFADVKARNDAPHPIFLPNSYGPAPFPAAEIERTNAIAREVGFTPAADRSAAGGGLALVEFLAIARQTPGLDDIVRQAIDEPSLWSFLNVGRIGASFPWAAASHVVSAFDAQLWHWPSLPIYRGVFLLVLNGSVAANVALYATAPQPPLETSAGIVGFTVEPPGHPDRRLEMRVVSAVPPPSPGS